MSRSNTVITGIGVVSSIGIGADDFFQALLNKSSGVRSLAQRTDDGPRPPEDAALTGHWIGAPILNFEPKQYVRPRKALKVMCREIQTTFAASQLAIADAGLSESLPATEDGTIKPGDIGTVFGSEMFYGPSSEMEDALKACMDESGKVDAAQFGNAAMKNIMPLWMLKYLPNMPACHVGISINAHGPNNTQVLGDVSGPASLAESVSCIERGIAKAMICGGVGTRISTTRLNYRGDLPVASVHDPVELSSRPHDPDSAGVVGGEGAVAIMIESDGLASTRGCEPVARVIATASRFLASTGMRQDRSSSNDQPEIRGSSRAVELAIEAVIEAAGINHDQIGLIVSHAAGDPVMDAAEAAAINNRLPSVPVLSPIANLGHTGAASGAFGFAIGALCVQHQKIPPALVSEVASPSVLLSDGEAALNGKHVLCLAHTPEGAAWAVLLA